MGITKEDGDKLIIETAVEHTSSVEQAVAYLKHGAEMKQLCKTALAYMQDPSSISFDVLEYALEELQTKMESDNGK